MTKEEYLILQSALDNLELFGEGQIDFLAKLEEKDPEEELTIQQRAGLTMLANKMRVMCE